MKWKCVLGSFKRRMYRECTHPVLLNSKYKRTFVLIERHSFLANEIFDFVNHSPVCSRIYWLLFFLCVPFYKSGSQIMRHERHYEHHATSLLLLYYYNCTSILYIVFYYTCGLWHILSIQCFVKYLVSCNFKLSSYRNKVSANEILEGSFGIPYSNTPQIRDSIPIFTN